MKSPRVLLVDDHAMFRAGLCLVISSALPEAKLFEAGSLDEALNHDSTALDVVLLDINLKGVSGLEGLQLIKRKWPLVPVLMLSSQDEPPTVRQALARGASGFVSKAESASKIVETIKLALNGHFAAHETSFENKHLPQLTPRQREVLRLLHQGLSNKLISQQLNLSDNTVRRHVQDILNFFDVVNRSEAVFTAQQMGLLG